MKYISLDLLQQIESKRKPEEDNSTIGLITSRFQSSSRFRPYLKTLRASGPARTAVVSSPFVYPLATFGSIESFYLYEKRRGVGPVGVTGNFSAVVK